MARQKQTAQRRQPSSLDQGLPETPDHGWRMSNGNGSLSNAGSNSVLEKTKAAMNDHRSKEPSPLHALEQPGIVQLLICVAGIYASL